MNLSLILVVVVLCIYLVWRLMSAGNKKKHEQRRFSIRKHRKNKLKADDEDE